MKTCVDSGSVDTLLVWSNGMDFIVRQEGNVYDSSTHVIIQDGADTVFNISLPGEENTVDVWRAGFSYLYNTSPDALNDLFTAIPELLESQVSDEAHRTYLQVLRALFKWLEEVQEQSSTAYDLQNLGKVYKQLELALFQFKVEGPHNGVYEAVFSQPGEELWRIKIPSDKFDRSPVPV